MVELKAPEIVGTVATVEMSFLRDSDRGPHRINEKAGDTTRNPRKDNPYIKNSVLPENRLSFLWTLSSENQK